MNDIPRDSPPTLNIPTVGSLFSGFFQAGVLGFGGVLPVIRRVIIDQRQWMTAEGFNDLFTLCQFLPGANIVNFACAFGARDNGVKGAVAALVGLLSAPIVIILCISALYQRYGAIPIVQHGLGGLAAAASGLLMGTSMKMSAPILRGARQIAVTGLTFGLMVLAHFSLDWTMLVVLPVSLALAWRS